jgi:DNA-binding NtrC family response regulator
VVKQAGGGIYVYSEPGRGSSFKIYLPRVSRADAVTRPVDGLAPREIEGGNETVLLVEDDDAVRRQVAEMLRTRGYHVLDVEGAERALELLRERPGMVDLLLTDIVLRGMNGPDLAQIVTRQSLARRVLFISGYAEAAVYEWVLAGGWPFLPKPFTPATLSRKVRDVLDAKVPPSA